MLTASVLSMSASHKMMRGLERRDNWKGLEIPRRAKFNSEVRQKKTTGAYLVLNLLACRQGDFFGKDVVHAVQFHRLTPIIEGACDEHLVRTVRPTCKCEEPTSQRANPGRVSVPRNGRLELIVDEGRQLEGLLSRALE